MRSLGYCPLYLREADRGALALVRGWLPGIGRITGRASLFAPGSDVELVNLGLRTLADLGIPYVKVGDTMWGLTGSEPNEAWPFPRTRVTQRHTFVVDLEQTEAALLKNQDASVRTSARRAERAGVKIREISSPADLDAYCTLAGETSSRVRAISAYTDFPPAFFREIYWRMAPGGAAKLYLACVDDTALAGAICLCSREQMLYFAGASTRDRKWTSLQAPTAVLWHAIKDARHLGLRRIDLGGCTPTDDTTDPRHGVYAFKKRWGGRLETFYNLEVILSPLSFQFQERVLSPLWNRLHPLYFKVMRLRRGLP